MRQKVKEALIDMTVEFWEILDDALVYSKTHLNNCFLFLYLKKKHM